MIRIYLQYSYGGFKTFSIKGKKMEAVEREVDNENQYGFPKDAYCYFQYGGAKLVYRYLDNGELDLVVREIPSIHKDGDGRSIPCAVQFVGEPTDRKQLDYMAADIANNINQFHEFFSLLFRVRDGLRIDGDRLRKWIDDHNKEIVIDSPVKQIANIPKVKSDVILFVPLSANFLKDSFSTDNTCKELNLPLKQMKSDGVVIRMGELSEVQGETTITTKPSGGTGSHDGDTVTDNRDDVVVNNGEDVQKLKAENEDLKSKNKELQQTADNNFNQLKKKTEELETAKTELAVAKSNLQKNKKVTLIIGGVAVILAIYGLFATCSGKKNDNSQVPQVEQADSTNKENVIKQNNAKGTFSWIQLGLMAVGEISTSDLTTWMFNNI